MAPSQFASMLHRRANKISTILIYAVLEWVLIVLLLLNSLFYYIIRKFAKRFGLKPPCLFCSRVEYLLEPHSNANTYENLMCETHATEISSLKCFFSHHKLTECNNLCENCFAFQHIRNEKIIKLSSEVALVKWLGKDVAKNDDGNRKCSFCDEDLSSCLLLKPSGDILEHAQKTYLIAEMLQDEKWNINKSDVQEHCCEEERNAVAIAAKSSDNYAEHNALWCLQTELEEERNAAAIAANQTMTMITRLQEEKSAMQMEALHYQRMMEEQSEYDQEALQILNALIIKREKEKLKLEEDLELYKKKVFYYEAKEKMMTMVKVSQSVTSINSSDSSSNIDDDELFIDFIHEDTEDDQCDKYNSDESVSEIEENGRECMKHLSILDESIAQFEDERVSILEELKALEGKLFTIADTDEETFEDRTLECQDRKKMR